MDSDTTKPNQRKKESNQEPADVLTNDESDNDESRSN